MGSWDWDSGLRIEGRDNGWFAGARAKKGGVAREGAGACEGERVAIDTVNLSARGNTRCERDRVG